MSFSWRAYWSERTDGGHRSQDESFLRKEAAEKLFHLGRGGAILDFGCGSADLLVHYAQHFRTAVGVDFSAAMLASARGRLKAFGRESVELVCADDATVWDMVAGEFNCITAGQVIQYFDDAQLDRFLARAVERLAPGGLIALFDSIDPRIYLLHELGLFAGRRGVAVVRRAAELAATKIVRRFRGIPPSLLGHQHPPERVRELAGAHGLEMELVWSMYYEYRYHALLRRRG